MRISIVALGALVLTAALPALVDAQPSRPPMPSDSARIEQTIADLKTQVKITDAQATTIRAILKENSAAMRRERENGTMDREAARARMRAVDDKIKAVLTPEQQPLYDKYRDERRQRMQQRMREIQERPQ